jgi:hypothetical protein
MQQTPSGGCRSCVLQESESYEYHIVRCTHVRPTAISASHGYVLQQGKSGAVPKIKEKRMQCNCGGEVTREIREIKTNAKAKEWMDGADACGREGRIVHTMQGDELYRKGL